MKTGSTFQMNKLRGVTSSLGVCPASSVLRQVFTQRKDTQSKMSGSDGSILSSGMIQDLGGDVDALKTLMNQHITKTLTSQKKVFETTLRNLKIIAIQETVDFIKSQSEQIEKLVTSKYHELIEQFIWFKERSEKRLKRTDEMELRAHELEMRYAQETASKEAMYAMDATNPLSMFDCLIPELAVYRPRRLRLTKQQKLLDHKAI